eukprot:285225-Pyramimonas_sp.AAC.1
MIPFVEEILLPSLPPPPSGGLGEKGKERPGSLHPPRSSFLLLEAWGKGPEREKGVKMWRTLHTRNQNAEAPPHKESV